MSKGDIIEMIYLRKNGEISQRHVKIVAVSDRYIKAFCYTRKQFRIFAKENILAFKRVKSA